jgi:hypothetical protein
VRAGVLAERSDCDRRQGAAAAVPKMAAEIDSPRKEAVVVVVA